MDLREITDTIEELENGDTTFDSCIKLSALYNVRDKLKSDTEKELNDILPQFRMYVAVKRKYQLRELTKEDLIFAMKSMCRDVEEFISTLYQNTELEEERELIKTMLNQATSFIETI